MTGTPPSIADRPELSSESSGLLEELLRTARLAGSVYMRACLSASFNICAPPKFDPASPLGRLRHVSIFHLVTAGGCQVEIASAGQHELKAGDILWIPLGLEHRLWQGNARPELAADLFRPGPLNGMWSVNHGGGGEETRMVCGWIESAEFVFLPMFRNLPPFLILRSGDDRLSAVVMATVRSILDLADAATPGTELVLGRLVETLFCEVLRRHAAQSPAATGWFAALRDPLVSRAMRLVHEDPARRWTVAGLAQAAGTSRTVLAQRFHAAMGRAPIEYVTSWRMQLAADQLRNGEVSLAAVAARAGYESEAAFSRAFKRITGVTPGRWRTGNAAG